MADTNSIAGLVLAGGRSSRFGGEKAAARLGERTLLQLALDRLARDCSPVAVSAASGSQAEQIARAWGAAVVHDPDSAPSGPLAGIAAGLAWARAHGRTLVAILPCDAPLLPEDLVRRLKGNLAPGAGGAVARTPDGLQSLCLVLRTELAAPLASILAEGRHPAVHDWLAEIHAREAAFPDAAAFTNVNAQSDLDAIASRRP